MHSFERYCVDILGMISLLVCQQLETQTFTDAPIGQATKVHAQSETDSAAYVKVGSLVAGAAVITYFGIPVASSVLSSLFGS